jgi:hypothetical protein
VIPSTKSAATPAATDAKPSRPSAKRRNAKTKLAKQSSAPKRGSKTAKILALLKRPGGVSLMQLQKATDWQAHSVRGQKENGLARPFRQACRRHPHLPCLLQVIP